MAVAQHIAGASLHVVHVVLSLDVGGLERNVVNQVREGQKLGQRVTIVCLDRPGTLAPQVEALGGEIVCLHRKGGLRPGMVMRMRQVLRQLRPDVVHTHQLVSLLYGGMAARMLRGSIVLHTEHGKEKYATRLRTRLLGRLAGRCCDRFLCLTADMAGALVGAGIVPEHKVRVIQNGIDVASFARELHDGAAVRATLGIPADALVIGTVGRLTEIKRQDVLLRAFAEVRQQHATAHLVLVGDGPLMAELKELANDLGVGAWVHFAGYQPHSGPYLKAMDVFALTSRSEGMPQAVLEASVMGLPVAASRVGGLPEVVENGVTGVLCEVGNHGALARAFLDFIGDPAKAGRMGAAARERVMQRFSVARMAREYHEAALELMGKLPAKGGETQVPAFQNQAALAFEEVR